MVLFKKLLRNLRGLGDPGILMYIWVFLRFYMFGKYWVFGDLENFGYSKKIVQAYGTSKEKEPTFSPGFNRLIFCDFIVPS